MKTSQHQRLAAWLHKRHAQETETIELWRGGVESQMLDQWPAGRCDQPRDFSVALIDAAQDDAEAVGESCVYQVRHMSDGSKKGQMSFRRDAAGAAGSFVGTASEQVTQALAHNERLMEMFAGTMGQLLRAQERQLDRAYARMDHLEGQLQSAYEMRADAMAVTAAADAQLGEAEVQQERAKMLTAKVGKLIDLATTKATMDAMQAGKK